MNNCCIETSPNCDARPADESASLVVIHAISLPPDRFGGPGVRQLFLNCLDPSEDPFYAQIQHLRVSAHYFIRRTGELVRFVPPEARAWHAGASSWRGRERCNDFSIGIELEGCDTLPFEPVQYRVLADLLDDLCRRFPVADIVGHSDIAPGRKTDPGPFFDWQRLRGALSLSSEALRALAWKLAQAPSDGPLDPMRWPFPLAGRPG